MNFIIVDLEATCGDGVETSEIIEIGAVKLNEKLEVVDEFQAFVRPTIHPQITYFCEELTTITQSDVDNAEDFDKVCKEFRAWCSASNVTADIQPYYLCSWGFYDKKMLKQDCELWRIDTEWIEPHISIKHQFGELLYAQEKAYLESRGKTLNAKTKQLKRGVGMNKALEMLNIKLEGTHHRGIDDSRNIAKIFVKIFNDLKFD